MNCNTIKSKRMKITAYEEKEKDTKRRKKRR